MPTNKSNTNTKRKRKIRNASILIIVIIFVISFYERLLVEYGLLQCRVHKDQGEMGWAVEVSNEIAFLDKYVSNKRMLVRRLLAQEDGSLVAEGMALIVKHNEQFPDAKDLLKKHLKDQRWNDALAYNSEFAKMCLIALKIKQSERLTQEETQFIKGWRNVLDKTFGIKYKK